MLSERRQQLDKKVVSVVCVVNVVVASDTAAADNQCVELREAAQRDGVVDMHLQVVVKQQLERLKLSERSAATNSRKHDVRGA